VYERFTDQARKVVQAAEEEAERLNFEYIGTEHILLALVSEDCCVAANVLKHMDIGLARIQTEVEKLAVSFPPVLAAALPPIEPMPKVSENAEKQAGNLNKNFESGEHALLGRLREEPGAKLPQTPRVKKVIESAEKEARNLNQDYVGTEHLLLGLLREEHGVAAQILMNMGLTLDDVRGHVTNTIPCETRRPPVEDPCSELPDMPVEAFLALLEVNAKIDCVTRDKDAAVAEADFEKAALLRDQSDKLKRERAEIIRLWRTGAEE
jgi:ATP-dependent Clp protease ATP-binding subunit ClpA